ncbi:EamA family transporter [Phytomonospora sp. NPDC050363]|uniref:DMT family transporter n=1 Tax=Phytomonospora sp. NPDC050363 TaxID=3155642 RepID=UPI0034045E15
MPKNSPRVRATAARRGITLLVLAGVLWGTGGLSGAALAESAGLSSPSVAAYRLLAGGVLLTAFALATGRLSRLPRRRGTLVHTALTGALLAVFQASFFGAVAATSVSLAALTTMVAVPVLVAFGSCALQARRPSPALLAGVATAGLGLVLLLGAPSGEGDVLTGTVLALTAAAGFAAVTLNPGAARLEGHELAVTALAFLAGGFVLLPFAAVTGMALPMRPEPLAGLLFLGLVPTAIAYTAYFAGLRLTEANAGVVAALLEPLTSVVLSVLLFGEDLRAVQVGGVALVLASIVMQRPRAPREA